MNKYLSLYNYFKKDPKSLEVIFRTCVNLLLVLADALPFITIITDLVQTFNFLSKLASKFGYKIPNLTPDVPLILLGTDVISNTLLELTTGGTIPNYFIVSFIQFLKDKDDLNKILKDTKKIVLTKSNQHQNLEKQIRSAAVDAEIIKHNSK